MVIGEENKVIIVRKEEKSNKEFDPFSVGKYLDIRVDDHPDPLNELDRLLNLWIATFFDEEFVNIEDYKEEIEKALKKLGFKSLREWVELNNFEGKYTGDKIGKSVLRILLSKA